MPGNLNPSRRQLNVRLRSLWKLVKKAVKIVADIESSDLFTFTVAQTSVKAVKKIQLYKFPVPDSVLLHIQRQLTALPPISNGSITRRDSPHTTLLSCQARQV